MANSGRSSDPTFGLGCHLTWPEFRECKTKKLEQRREWLSQVVKMSEECDFSKCPTDFCYLVNLQGYIEYSLGQVNLAIGRFNEVLSKDPTNVNALGNLYFIYKDQGRLKLLEEYTMRLKKILDYRSTHVDDIVVSRAYADRGRSVKWFTSHDDKQSFRYITYTRKAAEIAWSLNTLERGDWLFDYGLVLYIKDSYLVNFETSEETLQASFNEGVRCFYEVTQSLGTMERTRALSWVFMGILVNHRRPTRSIADAIPEISQAKYLTAAECFDRAIEISNHYAVIRRIGSEYAKMKDYQRAELLLTQANDKLPSWFTFRRKANMYVAMYNDQNFQGSNDKKFLLEQAILDLKQAMTFENTHADHSDLGYVYYLLDRYEDALEQFSIAVKCELMAFDFFDPALTYERWAKCLEAVDELDSAKTYRERAKEKRERWRKDCMVWINESWDEDDVHQDNEIQDDSVFVTEDRPGFVNIMKRMTELTIYNAVGYDSGFKEVKSSFPSFQSQADNFSGSPEVSYETSSPPFFQNDELVTKRESVGLCHGRKPTFLLSPKDKQMSGFEFDFFMCHSHRDRDWVTPFFTMLENSGLKGCLHDRDFTLGRSIFKNICHCIRQSYKTVVVMTPNFIKSRWCQYEVRQALLQSMERDSIVPILLKQCQPPDEIADLTYLPCYQGQIKDEDWDRLLQVLKQR